MMNKRFPVVLVGVLVSILAQAATYYGFKIGGVSVNSDNYQNVTGGGIDSGTVTYNPDTKVVTLTNVSIKRTGSNNRAIYNESCPNLRVRLVGNCNLVALDAAPVRAEQSTALDAIGDARVSIAGKNEDAIYIAGNCYVMLSGDRGSSFEIVATNSRAIACESEKAGVVYFEPGITATINGSKGCIVGVPKVHFISYLENPLEMKLVGNSGGYKVVSGVTSWSKGQNETVSPSNVSFDASAGTLVQNGSPVTSETVRITYAIPIQADYFPDANLRKYLLAQNYGKDGFIESSEIVNLKNLMVYGRNIASLTGVKYLKNLESIYAYSNNITSLTIGLDSLKTLSVANNGMTMLDVGGCSKLESLYARNNQLATLHLSSVPTLKSVDLSENPSLKSVTLLKCNNLEMLQVYLTGLTSTTSLLDRFINGLPTVSTGARLYVADFDDSNETSILTSDDHERLAAIKARGWTPYYKKNQVWTEYEGEEPFIRGDVNMDGEVGIADVTALVNIVLVNDSPIDAARFPSADVNEDGEVGIADVTTLVNMLLAE